MLTIQIEDKELEQQLRELSRESGQSYEDIIKDFMTAYSARRSAMLAMQGMFDDDVTDLSTTVRETMKQFYEQRSDSSD